MFLCVLGVKNWTALSIINDFSSNFLQKYHVSNPKSTVTVCLQRAIISSCLRTLDPKKHTIFIKFGVAKRQRYAGYVHMCNNWGSCKSHRASAWATSPLIRGNRNAKVRRVRSLMSSYIGALDQIFMKLRDLSIDLDPGQGPSVSSCLRTLDHQNTWYFHRYWAGAGSIRLILPAHSRP